MVEVELFNTIHYCDGRVQRAGVVTPVPDGYGRYWRLWRHFLRHDPSDPNWPDRDRFVLSNGHASMVLYSVLHLSGYDFASKI